MASKQIWTTLAGAAALALGGCELQPAATSDPGTGQIELALTAMAGSATYALANATFGITRIQPPPAPGDIGGLRLHPSDPTAGDLIVPNLSAGRYTVALLDGWQLERVDAPTTLVPVEATLLSANPITVSVFSGQTATVSFHFETTGVPLTFGPGALDIGVDVGACDAAPPAGVELNVIANHNFELNTDGWTAPEATLALSSSPHCGAHSAVAAIDPMMRGSALFAFSLPNPDIETTYAVSAWVMSPEDTSTFVRTSGVGCSTPAGGVVTRANTAGSWQRLSATVSGGGPGCTGVILIVGSTSPTLFLDDAYAVPQ
jgi:hypothetical protein